MSGLVDKVKSKTGSSGLSAGSKLPYSHKLKEDNPEQGTIDLATLRGKNIIVGVPGAFTPPCSQQVPGYLRHAEKFLEKGVQGIYIVAVNDAFTTIAWKEKLGAKSPYVHFLADDDGHFTKEAGMAFDATGLLGGHRSKRYAAIVEDGVVRQVWVEDEAPSVTVTSADNVLKAL